MSHVRLIDHSLPNREDVNNFDAFSVCIKYLDSYIEQDWEQLVSVLTDKELDRRYRKSDFYAHTAPSENRNSIRRYIKEILPTECGEEELLNYRFLEKDELSEPRNRVSYTFRLTFKERNRRDNRREDGEQFTEKVKFYVLNERREWKIDNEHKLESGGILGSVGKYFLSFFVRNEVCCVV